MQPIERLTIIAYARIRFTYIKIMHVSVQESSHAVHQEVLEDVLQEHLRTQFKNASDSEIAQFCANPNMDDPMMQAIDKTLYDVCTRIAMTMSWKHLKFEFTE